MKCEMAKDNIVLAYYGELPDELSASLEATVGGPTEEDRLASSVAAKLAVANPKYLQNP